MQNSSRSIFITGASSGLGKALAYAYAGSGITLFLTGRDKRRLKAVAETVRKKGANVYFEIVDVTDKQRMQVVIDKFESIAPIDIVIANAGVSAGTAGGDESINQVLYLFEVNVNGVIHSIAPVIDYMKKRQRGQIALMSSLSAYRGLPGAPTYSASKAAVKVFGEGLRGVLASDNIGVTVITPGYVKTPLTDRNNYYMPFLIDCKKAARIIKKRLQGNPARIAFPLPLYFVVWFLSILPPSFTDKAFGLMPKKGSFQ